MENHINRKISRPFPISFGSSCRFTAVSDVIQHSIVASHKTRRPKRPSSSPRIRESTKIVPEFRNLTLFSTYEDSKHTTSPYPGNSTLFSSSSDSSYRRNRRNPQTSQNPPSSSSITNNHCCRNGQRNEIRGSGGGGANRRWEVAAGDRKKVEEESYVVAKTSRDPYRDFRESMVQMIVEKKIRGAEDLEKLLESFLGLNDSYHHQVILHAFSDICEALFSFS